MRRHCSGCVTNLFTFPTWDIRWLFPFCSFPGPQSPAIKCCLQKCLWVQARSVYRSKLTFFQRRWLQDRAWSFYLCTSACYKGRSLSMGSKSILWIETMWVITLRGVSSFQACLSSCRRGLERTGQLGDHRPSSCAWNCTQGAGVIWHRACWRSCHQTAARGQGW